MVTFERPSPFCQLPSLLFYPLNTLMIYLRRVDLSRIFPSMDPANSNIASRNIHVVISFRQRAFVGGQHSDPILHFTLKTHTSDITVLLICELRQLIERFNKSCGKPLAPFLPKSTKLIPIRIGVTSPHQLHFR